MPRHDSGVNELLEGHGGIQKRFSSSPSSTSYMSKNYRFKRTVLVGKRKGSTTPVPLWRMNARSPCLAASFSETSLHQPSKGGAKESQISVSARKLANALWELNHTPSPEIIRDRHERKLPMDIMRKDRTSGSFGAGSLSYHLSNRLHSPISELCNRPRSSSHRKMLPPVHQKFHCKEHNHVISDLLSKVDLMESEACFQGLVPRSSHGGRKNYLKELQNGLVTSKELLKILVHFCGIGKQQPSAVSLATALYCQLDRALVQVNQLIQEKRSDHTGIRYIMKQLVEEKEAWQNKKREGTKVSLRSMIEELETERKLRRRAERISKKLEVELSQLKNSLVDAGKELESERRTREIIEQVCSEMIRGIGEDKAEVEELKRESAKVREELEKEREMLQLADEWREERVQMKLSEAKCQFEEKNAAVDQLRHELEAFLAAKRTEVVSTQQSVADGQDSDRQMQVVHPSRSSKLTNLTVDGRDTSGEKDQEENDGTDSEDSDLHSIELNINNGYNWSHASGATEDERKVALAKEHVSCGEFSSDRDMTKGNFARNFQHMDDDLDGGRPVGDSSLIDEAQMLDQIGDRYISAEELRDQTSAGSRIFLPHGLLNSTRQCIRQQASHSIGGQACVGSKVAEVVKAIRESESKASLVRKNKIRSQLQMATIQ
ncbi:uncharacterized protein At5g41620-like [Musa acuminata AAA Group]|uniref:uncharacterized protein At5g41620-like n=1 Tax=Musa acuminata AAA Group TaxID=214697 RepID=UPI0031D95E01